jgi:hypothetical protein
MLQMPDENIDYRAVFEDLLSLPPDTPAATKRNRGRRFERVLHAMLLAEGLEPRTSFRPEGEEIDGSFVLDTKVYLLEAKWHQDPLPASALYSFKGKIDGKLIGTVGVFISMSGFSEDAADALRFGKTVNLLLSDGDEITSCIRGSETFAHSLRTKLRAAAEEGLAYAPSRVRRVARASQGQAISTTDADVGGEGIAQSVIVVCEGPRDAAVLSTLTKRLLAEKGLVGRVSFFPAMGKAPLGGLVNIARHLNPEVAVIVVADADGNVADTQAMVASRATGPVKTIAVDPTIEDAWLGLNRVQLERLSIQAVERLAEKVRISDLVNNDVAFDDYAETLTHLLRG